MTRAAAVLVAALASVSVVDADPSLESAGPVPAELSAASRLAVADEGVRVSLDGKVLGEFWIRKDVPVRAEAKDALGVAFGRLEPGTFLGVARFPLEWSDYKGTTVAAGVYSLRYGIQPADGNHMGVSTWRDFALLVPAEGDGDPAALPETRTLVETAREPVRGAHPAVLSLFPAEAGDRPSLARNEIDQWMLVVRAGGTGMGLVVRGQGEP